MSKFLFSYFMIKVVFGQLRLALFRLNPMCKYLRKRFRRKNNAFLHLRAIFLPNLALFLAWCFINRLCRIK